MDRGIYNEKEFYEVDVPWSEKKMANFIRSLVQVNGIFTSSLYIGDFKYISGRHSVFFMIGLPKGLEQKFVNLTGISLKKATVAKPQ